ncbi:hypothetical protein Avbf_17937 [Armadillidium vulgare]|nr:hypothetical protein Avbf_17937 [Armadillidium vulgare]
MDVLDKVERTRRAFYALKFSNILVQITMCIWEGITHEDNRSSYIIWIAASGFIILLISCMNYRCKAGGLFITEILILLILSSLYASCMIYMRLYCRDNQNSHNQERNIYPTYLMQEATTAPIETIYEKLTYESTTTPIETTYEDSMEWSTTEPFETTYEDSMEWATTEPFETTYENLVDESTTTLIETSYENLIDESTTSSSEIIYENLTDESTTASIEIFYKELMNESLNVREKILDVLFEFDNTSEEVNTTISINERAIATDAPVKESLKKSTGNLKCDEFFLKVVIFSFVILALQAVIVIVAFHYKKFIKEKDISVAPAVFHQTDDGEGEVNFDYQREEDLLRELGAGSYRGFIRNIADLEAGTSQPHIYKRTDRKVGTSQSSINERTYQEAGTSEASTSSRAGTEAASEASTSSRADAQSTWHQIVNRADLSNSPSENLLTVFELFDLQKEGKENMQISLDITQSPDGSERRISENRNIGRVERPGNTGQASDSSLENRRTDTVPPKEKSQTRETVSEASANVTHMQYETPEIQNTGRFAVHKVKETTTQSMANTQSSSSSKSRGSKNIIVEGDEEFEINLDSE